MRPSFYQILFVLEKMLLARGVNMDKFKSHALIHSTSSSSNNGVHHANSSREVRLGAMREAKTAPPAMDEQSERQGGGLYPNLLASKSMSVFNM